MITRLAAFLSLSAALANFISPCTAHANLVLNGDFETHDLTSWTASGAVNVASDSAIRSGAGATGDFPSGHYAVVFGGGSNTATGVLTQDFSTVAGRQYSLTFDYGKLKAVSGPQSLNVLALNIADASSLLDTVVSDVTGQNDLGLIFDDYEFSFIATGSSSRLRFSDVSPVTNNTDGVLDNINLAPIFEPNQSVYFDPRSTYLKPVDPNEHVNQVQSARIINLATDLPFPVSSGEYVRIQAIGDFKFASPDDNTGGPFGDGTLRDAYGIFSSTDMLDPITLPLSAMDKDRVPDKKEVTAGHFLPQVTDPQNDIDFDFFIPTETADPAGAIVRVPTGAAYLFLSAADTVWYDNTDLDNNYGVRITRISPGRLIGDYNFNGVVDTADYAVWRKASGLMTTDSSADGDLDGDVDQADYNIWRTHFGQTVSQGSGASMMGTTVPEPTGLFVAALATALAVVAGIDRSRRP